MPLAVKEDKALDPIPVSLLRPEGEMLESHDLAALLLQSEFRIGDQALGWALRPLRLSLRSNHSVTNTMDKQFPATIIFKCEKK